MVNVENILKNTDASMKMEGMFLSDGDLNKIKACLEGQKDFSKTVADIVKTYTNPVKVYA